MSTPGEFALHYQPIVDLRSGEVTSAEALLRPARRGGSAPAGEPDSPRAIRELDRRILHAACADAKAWLADGLAVGVHVNFSARELDSDRFLRLVDRALEACGLEGTLLNVEITESSAIDDLDLARRILERLEERRVHAWLDDFGTGHSSLLWLKDFRVAGLKLPRELVSGLAADPRSNAIVASVLALAHQLEMRVIAEGVENERQVEFLRREGCDAIQGYYLAHPVPADQLRAVIGRRRTARG